ncbi:alpha/beta fold hydrolase [Candidatus Microgenomates bacterium]|nr:MAG: alpha/beta fold hydrolase [Candidatus Microgenomates bacterium]
MKRYLPILKLIIGWPLSLLALFFIYKFISSKTDFILPNLSEINYLVLFYSIICFLTFFFLRSYVWKIILKEKGSDIKFKEITFLWASSELKRFVPGNIWSFLGRTSSFSKKGVPLKIIFSSLVIEAQFFIMACLITSVFSLSFIVYNFFGNLYYLLSIFYLLMFLGIVIFIFNLKLNKFYKLPSFFSHILPGFAPKTNLFILVLCEIYIILFGLGTYLAISSIYLLSPFHLLSFIGIFAFSFLVGFLSIITPMGLGVREGIMAAGLSKFMPLNIAGIVSVYSRIVLIFSELLFFSISFIWHKTKSKVIDNLENNFKKYKYEFFLAIFVIAYILYFTSLSFLRFDNFFTGRFDLGNMDQTVWNTAKGRIFQLTDPNGTEIISRLAFHADFILVLLAPLYFLWPDPKMLLLIQTVVLALGAVFIFLISNIVIKEKRLSLIFSFAYLINPSLNHANLYDFHPVALATTFLLGAFYFFINKKYLLFLFFAILAALTKEQVWVIISIFGFLLLVNYLKDLSSKNNLFKIKSLIFGLILFFLPFVIFYYLVSQAIPAARGNQHFALTYYADFGDSPGTIIKNIIFSPQKTFSIITQDGKLGYLFSLFAPLGFLSLLSPILLIFLLPDLIINLLSNNSQLHTIYYQYTSTITPFIFITAIFGIKKIKTITPKIPNNFYGFFILAWAFYSAYSLGPLIGAKAPNIDMIVNPPANKNIIEKFLANIPAKYSIATTNNLGSHLSHRQKIFTIPVGIDKADIIFFLLNDQFAQPSLQAQKQYVEELKRNKNYIEIFKEGDFVVFEKRNIYLQSPPKISKIKLSPFSIPTLAHRDYVGSDITIERKIESNNFFNSYIISYLSDGLKLFALMNVPKSQKPEEGYPILILNHGYISPKQYSTVNSYKEITDYFSKNGFLVLKPDYRGNANSEDDEISSLRFSYPIDVLNLISSASSLKDANKNKIFLWGHSMGGEVTLKVLEIFNKTKNSQIKAAVVWSPVIDPIRWFSKNNLPNLPEFSANPFPYEKIFKVIGTPEKNPLLWQSLSPLSYLNNIDVPVQINHGTADEMVPYEWSVELYDDLLSLNKKAVLFSYNNDNHNLSGSRDEALKNALDFFNQF